MAKKLNLKGIVLNRTIGIEVEGYTKNITKLSQGVRHSNLKRDGSLNNSYGWNARHVDGINVGMEVVSIPLSKLDMLDEIFEDIQATKWNVGRGKAGTHIHVDVRDYTLLDRIKMAVLMEKLDDVMFLMVKPSRRTRENQRNRYCRPMDSLWSTIIRRCQETGLNINNHDNIRNLLYSLTRIEQSSGNYRSLPNWNRYNFANVFDTGIGTIEFRLFHAIRDSSDAKKFGLLAYHLIETVKHSSVEQLEFIAESINNSSSAEEMVKRLAESIGLEFTPKIYNNDLKDYINIRKSRQARAI
jgi:DNA-binding transcriptional MerR regulator